jgi:hypothetical protein
MELKMKKRVLILCTGNSAHSQMAEGLLGHDAGAASFAGAFHLHEEISLLLRRSYNENRLRTCAKREIAEVMKDTV